MTRCRACGAEIKFLKTPAGKMTPVNREYIPIMAMKNGAELFVLEDGSTIRGRRTLGSVADCYGYIAHFATCPEADHFRQLRKESESRE